MPEPEAESGSGITQFWAQPGSDSDRNLLDADYTRVVP